jgi:spermidine synthase
MLPIYFMFLASGAASLLYQVIWFKQLQLVLGSSTFAVSVTVASFFLGLALGSWVGGRAADTLRRPLLAYSLLELAVSVVSLLVTIGLSKWSIWAPGLTPLLGSQSLLAGTATFLVSFSTLILPTVFMGATLPVLAKYVVRDHQTLAQHIGILYGINTLGAAAGCAVAGLVLIGAFGVLRSAIIGSTTYMSIALVAYVIGQRRESPQASKQESKQTVDRAAASLDTGKLGSSSRVGILVFVFAVSGFTSIAYEVLWFRILSNFSLHTVYAFSAMLATYLLGLVLGSLICATFLANRKDRLLVYFAQLQLLIATSGMVTLALLGRSRNILLAIASLPIRLEIPARFLDPLASTTEITAFCLVVLLIPTTLIGIGFPLASELTIQQLPILGRRIGRLYAFNTLGGTLGSLTTGFLLLPLLGSQASLTVVIVLNLLMFVLLVVSQPSLRVDRKLRRLGLEGVIVFGVGVWYLGPHYLAEAQTKFEGGRVLAFEETRDATFVVMGYQTEQDGSYQQILVNGRSYANNSPPGRRYMATLAHLPALLHPEPRSVLVACVGTGTTVGALTVHPQIHSIKAVDLAQTVFDVAPLFEPLNHNFQRKPKVETVVADARNYLLRTEERFDIITFEPPPPQDAGVVNLYSREFYELAKRRLTEHGIVTQWVPLDLSRQALPLMMVRTVMAVFPHVSLWIPNRMEGVLIASQEPLRIDLADWEDRMKEPAVRADLEAIGFHSPEDLAGTFVAADAALARFVGDGPQVTDDRPRIEYFNFYPINPIRYDDIIGHREGVERYLTGAPPNPSMLDSARNVITLIWKEHEAAVAGRSDEMNRLVRRALSYEPTNSYLIYLRATHEQRGD